MSAADDVLEMRELCASIAGNGSLKQQVSAVSRALGVGWNRALELLKGKARRVDAWEKENAKRRVEALRRQAAVNQIANLNRTLEYLRSSDPDGYRGHIDRLEHALSRAGVLDRAVAAPDTSTTTTPD